MSSTRAFHPSVTPLETRTLLTTGTRIALQVSSAASIYGQAETIRATVTTTPPSGITPTGGTVTFEDSGAALASEPLMDGTASFTTTELEAGLHVITAIYDGDTDFTGSATAPTPTSMISVIAGNTDNGDGGPANIAVLDSPEGLALDAQGDLFIADTSDDQIREVNRETGVISTVAGDGQSGYAGDGGPATDAQLDDPTGVAVDAAGGLFIADAGNEVVREVKDGTITTIAGDGTGGYSGDGGPATAAELDDPTSVAVNAQGDLFIADSQNDVIREVKALNGVITTIAGDGQSGYSGDGGTATSAELDDPLGVAVDAKGDLFIADTSNHSVREVNSATGVISTVAGDGTPGYTQPEGTATGAKLLSPDAVAVDGQGDLFIADDGIDAVLEVTAGVIAMIAGDGTYGYQGDDGAATAAELAGPSAVAVNGQGDVLVADSGNDVIREVAAGTITTVAGDHHIGRAGDGQAATAAELDDPTGVAMDAQGDLFIADSQDNVVREVNAVTGIISTVAGDGQSGYSGDGGSAIHAALNDPIGVAVDSSGDLFIADSGNNVVREVSGGVISTVAGNGTSGYVGDGRPALEAELDDPVGVAVDSSGDLFIADSGNNVVREVTHGLILTVAGDDSAGYSGDGGPATSAALANPSGVAVDSQGDLFIADSGNNVVREVTGGVISTVAGDGTAGYDGDGGPAEAAALDDPTGIAVDSSGDLFVAETGNSTVREVIGSVISTIAGNGNYGAADLDGPATSTELGDLGGVTVDASGNVFVSDGSYHVVYEVPTITVAQDVSVAPAPLTVTANPQDMTYGGAVPALTYQITGFVNGDTIAAIGGTPSVSTTASSATGVGSYPILVTAGTLVAANYDFPSANLVDSTLSIKPAPLTVTAVSQTMIYGSPTPALTDQITGFVNGDTIAVVSGAPTLSTAASPSSRTGVYPILVAAGTLIAANYDFPAAALIGGSLTIVPAPLTITASSTSMIAGQAIPGLTATYQGFVNGDTAASLTSPAVLFTTATSASAAGVFSIIVRGASSPNYAITFVNGTINVLPARVAPPPVVVPPVSIENISVRKLKVGKKTIQVIVIQFSGVLNTSDAQNMGAYSLKTMPKGKKPQAKSVAVKQAVFNVSADTVTLTPQKALVLNPPLRLTIQASELLDTENRPVEGNTPDQSGSLFVATISKSGVTL